MTIIEAFSGVKDPRRTQGLRTDLDQILYMVIISYLCGYTGYREIGKFCSSYAEVFIKELSLRDGAGLISSKNFLF